MQNQLVQDYLNARNRFLDTGYCPHEGKFRKLAKIGSMTITQCGICAKIFDKVYN